jgi:hypothetical protein
MTTGRINQVAAVEKKPAAAEAETERIQNKTAQNLKAVLDRMEEQNESLNQTEPWRKASLSVLPAHTSDSEKRDRGRQARKTLPTNRNTPSRRSGCRASKLTPPTRPQRGGGRRKPDWQTASNERVHIV